MIDNPTLLVDGDIIRYRCAFAAEKTYYLVTNDGMLEYYDTAKEAKENAGANYVWSRKEVQPVEFALQAAKTTLDSLIERFKPKDVKIFLSGPGNFRDLVAVTKPHKGNRLEAKPRHFNAVGEYLRTQWGAESVRGIEADDAIGIALSKNGDRAVAASIDKDLLQVPGWHYNWVDSELFGVSRKKGDYALYRQILTGDTTDNVPGLEGVGPAAAGRILEGSKDSGELRERTAAAYRDRGKSVEYLLEQAQLL